MRVKRAYLKWRAARVYLALLAIYDGCDCGTAFLRHLSPRARRLDAKLNTLLQRLRQLDDEFDHMNKKPATGVNSP